MCGTPVRLLVGQDYWDSEERKQSEQPLPQPNASEAEVTGKYIIIRNIP